PQTNARWRRSGAPCCSCRRERGEPLRESLALHSEHTVVRSLNRCVERRAQGDGDGIPGIDRIENAVVPDFGGRVVRTRLTPVVIQNRIANCREFLFRQLLPVSGKLPYFYIGQYARRLLR